MKTFFKVLAVVIAIAGIAALFAGCGGDEKKDTFDNTENITVVAREESSGTRDAFHTLMKIKTTSKDASGKDITTDDIFEQAIISNETNAVVTTVEGDEYAIGYISTGSLSDRIKASSVDGVAATIDNVKNGTYKVQRPFIVATKGEASGIAKDLIAFINSKQGQAIIKSNKYIIQTDSATDYVAANLNGTLKISGSTSVGPLMEKLTEEYKILNPNVNIEIQQNGSGAGITDAIDGRSDLAMSSRALKDTETAVLKPVTICLDGVAVIVNKTNPITNMSSDNITKVFKGELRTWDSIQ